MLNTTKMRLATGILAISLLFGCSGNMLSGGMVAKINNQVISKAEFQKTYSHVLSMMHLDAKNLSDPKYDALTHMFKKITLENLILSTLVKQEAEKRHITVSDKDVEAAYQKQVTKAGGEKALEKQLKSFDVTQADFKDELKDQILRDKLITDIAGDKYKVSEAEAKAFYTTHQKDFDRPEQVKASHILVSADPKQIQTDYEALKKNATPEDIAKQVASTMAQKKAKAEELYNEVKAHPDQFAQIAEKNSDDTASAKNGGDLGYFSKGMMVPAFSDAAFDTKPGQIHDGIVQSPFGYHIIEVMDRRAPEKESFTQVKDRLIAYLENQRKTQLMQDWIQKKKSEAKIELAPKYRFLEDKKTETSANDSGDSAQKNKEQ